MTVRPVALRLAVLTFVIGLLLGLVVPKLLASTTAPPPGEPRIHVVKSGETLWSVAIRYGGSRDPRRFIYDVETVNRLTGVQVVPGQKLIIPG